MPTGHLEKRAESAWSIVIDLGRDPAPGRRQRIRRTVKGATKRQAEAEMRRLLAEIESGTYVEPTKVTVAEFLRTWLKDSAAPRLRPKTARDYSLLIERHIVPALGHIPLSALQPIHLQDFYRRTLEAGRLDGKGALSARSVVLIHVVVHAALKQAVKWQMVPRNAADAVDPPRPRRPKMTTLDADGVKKLLAKTEGHRDRLLIETAVRTGLRRGELLALRWEDIDLDAKVLRVQHGLVRLDGHSTLAEPKTKGSRRQVPLSDDAVGVLREVRRAQAEQKLRLGGNYGDRSLVFCNPDGSVIEPSSVSHRFKELVEAAGFQGLRFHDLRHTYATLLLAKGVHPKVVQECLGHESISTTMDTYSHVLPSLLREAAEKIDEALGHRLGTGTEKRPR